MPLSLKAMAHLMQQAHRILAKSHRPNMTNPLSVTQRRQCGVYLDGDDAGGALKYWLGCVKGGAGSEQHHSSKARITPAPRLLTTPAQSALSANAQWVVDQAARRPTH